jgi:hypothetical protein
MRGIYTIGRGQESVSAATDSVVYAGHHKYKSDGKIILYY